jgi:hypothetical protein
LFILKYVHELADFSRHLIAIFDETLIHHALIQALFHSPIALHLLIHILAAVDFFFDKVIDKNVEYFDDLIPFSSEFVGLLFQKIPTEVNQEHL